MTGHPICRFYEEEAAQLNAESVTVNDVYADYAGMSVSSTFEAKSALNRRQRKRVCVPMYHTCSSIS